MFCDYMCECWDFPFLAINTWGSWNIRDFEYFAKMHLWFTLHFDDDNGNINSNSSFWIAPWARSLIKEFIFPLAAINTRVLWNIGDCCYLHRRIFSIMKYKPYSIDSNQIIEKRLWKHITRIVISIIKIELNDCQMFSHEQLSPFYVAINVHTLYKRK